MSNLIDPDSRDSIRHQLRSILLHRIAEGSYLPGRRLPSERVLAELFGVSRTSVRETLAQLISAGVLERAAGRGTFVADRKPDQARGPAERQRQVGFWISANLFNFVQPGYSQILTGAGEQCRNRGYRLQFHAVDESEQSLEFIFTAGEHSGGVDGNLVVGGVSRRVLGRLQQLDCPLLSVDLLLTEAVGDVVRIDYDSGIRQAVEHLADLKHRDIGFIGFAGSRKYEAFWQSLDSLGLTYNPSFVSFLSESDLEPGMLAGYEGMRKLIARGRLPTAFVITNDHVAIGAMEALAMAGLPVPDAISLIGCDDLGLGAQPLTTIQVDLIEVGRVAANRLLDRIEGQAQAASEIVIPVKLVVRSTSANAPAAVPLLSNSRLAPRDLISPVPK